MTTIILIKTSIFPFYLKYGDILIKYAVYSNLEDKTIKDKFTKHGIQPMSQIAYTKGKNAVDIRMTIEAMSLLNKEYVDTICKININKYLDIDAA